MNEEIEEPAELTEAKLPEKETAKKGKPPKQSGPKYLVKHTAPNRAARRMFAKAERAEANMLESWKRRLTRAGIDVEAEIAKKLARYKRELGMEIVKKDTKETSDGEDREEAAEDAETEESGS